MLSLQNLIEEREKLFNEKFCDKSGEWKGYWQEVEIYARDVKQFQLDTINLVIDGVVEMAQDLKTDERKIHDFREWSAETYEEKMLANAILDTVISQLQTLKK
jgi:hypothetical protein